MKNDYSGQHEKFKAEQRKEERTQTSKAAKLNVRAIFISA